MSEVPPGLLKILNLAGEEGSRPLDRLEKGEPLAPGRAAVAQSGLAPLVQSALFLYFDCFDEAHNLAQDHEGTAGNWLHAIAHRREPDASNSKYWYARVRIPEKASRAIAEGALRILGAKPFKELEAFQKKLAKSGKWEAEDFVDLCDKARRESVSTLNHKILARIQEAEWRGLLEYILNP